MLHFRNSLLSHLSPSLLTKMSVAVFATFSSSVYAADNPAAASIVTNIVSSSKASESALAYNLYATDAATPENLAVSAYSFAVTQNAGLAMEKAIQILPTIPESQSYVAENSAIDSASQIISVSNLRAVNDINAFIAASVAETASNAVNQVSRAFDDVPSGVKAPSNKDETTIRAEQMTGRPSRVLNFDGQVEIVRGTSTIDSATAEYHGVEDLVMANRNVQMFRDRDC